MTSVVAGHDDNLTGGSGTGEAIVPRAMASGSVQSLDATLRYFHGNTARSFRVLSTGNVLAFPDYLQRPAAGGVISMDARTRMGDDWTFRASERAGYEPFFDVFSPGGGGIPLAAGISQAVPATAIFELRSLNSLSLVSIGRQWTGRDSTAVSYSYEMRHFIRAERGDNISHTVGTEYRRRLTPATTARAAYAYGNREYTAYGGTQRPIREHRIEGGPEIEKVLSRRRRFSLFLAAGANYFESIGSITREPYHVWVPIGSASATLVLSSALSVDGGYRRGFSLLPGLTDEVYTTDTAFLTTRLLVTRHTEVRIGGTAGNWKTALAAGGADRLRVYGASLQLNVPLTASVAATAGYNYYRHHYSNPSQLPAGFPPAYDRQAFRVGLTLVLPLVGTSPSSPQTPR